MPDGAVRICDPTDIVPADPANPSAPAAAPTRALTLTDIANFTPIVGELVVQPDGWAVTGRPTNFYATAGVHTVDGTLFDQPVTVRWTPVAYAFDFGDGTIVTTETAGAAWQGEDAAWTETATSHTYQDRTDRTATVTVTFAAEVDAGFGWFAVAGTIDVAAPSEFIKVYTVSTVLVRGDCFEYPDDPGCTD